MTQDKGASRKRDRATRASTEPASSLGHPASVPSAALALMVERVEAATAVSDSNAGPVRMLEIAIHDTLFGMATYNCGGDGQRGIPQYLRSFDAALGLLPEGADWRRLTPMSVSIYAASPYNAAAQKRHDGYGPTPAAQLVAAIFKMRLAKAKQMERPS